MAKRESGGRTRVPPRFNETVKRLTLELQEANRHLVFADLPQDTVEELSQTVDHVRSTVWAVLNSMVDEFASTQRATVILTSHRIQRAQALMAAINAEIDAGHLTRSTQGIEELRNMLAVAYKKIHYLLTGKPAPPEPA
jgi:hypothetical protein